MEKENLSQSFIQKYDTISDTFVVVEKKTDEQKENKRRFEPFSFFRNRNRQIQTLQSDEQLEQSPPQPPMPPNNLQPPQPPMPPANTPVFLAKDAHNKLRILNSLFQNLAILDPKNTEIYNSLAGETLILQTTMLSVYQTLIGNSQLPQQNQNSPILTGTICQDLRTTSHFIQEITDTVLTLQRSVNIQNIDRQLAIITATLLSQKSKISSLQSDCER